MTTINPIQIMELNKVNFSKTDLAIYNTIRKSPDIVIYKSISKLAETANVSQPAITRFIKTIGYESYREFRSGMAVYLASKQTTSEPESNTPGYFLTLKAMIDSTQHLLTISYMQKLAAYAQRFNRIYTTGQAKSYQPAELMDILSRKTSISVRAIRADYIGETCEIMHNDDLLIIFSVSGASEIMHSLEKTSGEVMLVTANPDSPYHKLIDKTIVLPYATNDPESSSVSPISFDIFAELLLQFMTAAA